MNSGEEIASSLGLSGWEDWGRLCRIRSCFREECLPNAEEPKFHQAAAESFEFGFSGLGPPGRTSGPSPDRREFS